MTIGARIKARRQELGITQRELAERMEYANHSTIARIEAGKVDLPQSRIAQFADILNTTPAHLLGWNAEPEDLGALVVDVLHDPDLLGMLQEYQGLSEADKYAVRLMISSLAAKKTD